MEHNMRTVHGFHESPCPGAKLHRTECLDRSASYQRLVLAHRNCWRSINSFKSP